MTRISVVLLTSAALVAAAGCQSTPTTPTNNTPTATSATIVFTGTFAPGGTPSHTFILPSTSPLRITFSSLTDASGLPLGSTVTMIFGIEAATNDRCDPLTSMPVTAALNAQISVTATAGGYCVGLVDTAGVPVAANYAFRLIYGTVTGTDFAGTTSYSSTLFAGGFTSRSFMANGPGVATLTMETFSPASVSVLGLGMGVPRNDGSGCEVSRTILATRGAQFSVPVDAGQYCVKVFDTGTITDSAAFVVRILHP